MSLTLPSESSPLRGRDAVAWKVEGEQAKGGNDKWCAQVLSFHLGASLLGLCQVARHGSPRLVLGQHRIVKHAFELLVEGLEQ